MDNLLSGVLLGAVFPLATWLLFNFLMPGLILINKPALPYFVTVLLNLLLIRFFYKRNAEKTTRGIMLSTFVFLVFIFLIKIKI